MENYRTTRQIKAACDKYLKSRGLLLDFRQVHDQYAGKGKRLNKMRKKDKVPSHIERAAKEIEEGGRE